MTDKVAKRRLKNFDFQGEGAHIALVHKDQGGAANGYNTLVMKSTGQYSQEFLQKAAQVKVTLSFEEFLQRFFGMWYDDAEVLATLLGMESEKPDDESESDWYQNYIAEQVNKFEILKSANDAENKVDFLSQLDEQDYLSILVNQERFEKALKTKVEPESPEPVKKVTKKKVTTQKATKAVHKEDKPNMSDPVVDTNAEMIAKAQYDEIQKAFNEQKEALEKATAAIEQYAKLEKAAKEKARQDAVAAAISDTDEAEKLFKAVAELSDDNFQAVVEIVKGLVAKVEDTALFTEQGAGVQTEQVQKSALQKELDKKYPNK